MRAQGKTNKAAPPRFESCPRANTSDPLFCSPLLLPRTASPHSLIPSGTRLQETPLPGSLSRRGKKEKVITRNRHSSIFIMCLNLCHRSSAFLSFLRESASSNTSGYKGQRGHCVFSPDVYSYSFSVIDKYIYSSTAVTHRRVHSVLEN